MLTERRASVEDQALALAAVAGVACAGLLVAARAQSRVMNTDLVVLLLGAVVVAVLIALVAGWGAAGRSGGAGAGSVVVVRFLEVLAIVVALLGVVVARRYADSELLVTPWRAVVAPVLAAALVGEAWLLRRRPAAPVASTEG